MDLESFVGELRQTAAQRIQAEVTSAQMLDYARERLDHEDPEWEAATAADQPANAWLAPILKRAGRPGQGAPGKR